MQILWLNGRGAVLVGEGPTLDGATCRPERVREGTWRAFELCTASSCEVDGRGLLRLLLLELHAELLVGVQITFLVRQLPTLAGRVRHDLRHGRLN